MATLKANDQLVSNIAELDFFAIKENLKTYLKAQTRFVDYDFDGSNLNELLDVLSYNTHYNAFYLNMVASEIFLDSAIRRESVVARARTLSYIPRSVRSATAIVTLSLTVPLPYPSQVIIPAQTRLATDIDGAKYTFQTSTEYVALPTATPGQFVAANVSLVEGRFFVYRKTVTTTEITDGVVIPNINADSSKLTVQVFQSVSAPTSVKYFSAGSMIDFGPNSSVFFISETDGLRYRIKFGDGVLGTQLVAGNVVQVAYYISSGALANGAAQFTPLDSISGATSYTTLTTTPASSGDSIETVESIKTNAPLTFQSQRRAVTAKDYVATVKANFPDTEVITVWGGEDNIPIALGYVFIAIKPFNRDALTDSEKLAVEVFLQDDYSVLTVVPIIVDPEFLYVRIASTVKYDPKITATSVATIESAIRDAIDAYFNNEVRQFGNYFRYSRLVRVIDAASPVVTNSLTDVAIERRINVSNQAVSIYRIEYFNPLIRGTISSEIFEFGPSTAYNAFIKDDSLGSLRLFYKVADIDTQIPATGVIGTVDYQQGVITITNLVTRMIDANVFNQLRIFGTPVEDDVFGVRNLIVTVASDTVSIATRRDDVPA